MKQHPILFSTPMVQAILEGRKTMTRRIIKPQPIDNTEEDGNFFEGNHKGYVKVDGHPYWRDQFVHEFSKKQVGDILWVREAWNVEQYPVKPEGDYDELLYFYKATEKEYTDMKWRPSIFMPKEACRLYLEITGIRVERLQDISEKDAIKEGIEFVNFGEFKIYKGYCGPALNGGFTNPKIAFENLWESINGSESLEANPWVWVVSFKKIEKPN